MKIYENIDVLVTVEKLDEMESEVKFNGSTLFIISSSDNFLFESEFRSLINKFRI